MLVRNPQRRREISIHSVECPTACINNPVRFALLAGVFLVTTMSVHAAPLRLNDIADLSLEELANIRITSVSKKPESIANVAASIFVITNEDIRRSGATSLPEALRLAPNLQVARVNARNYAISARGFNNVFANKLQVLIDGRTIYTPLFAGVFWDVPDVVLEDIERIEVISGAGGTIWGANAVNGVINVITRSAKDTQGGMIAAGGSKDQKTGALRYGGSLGADGHFRIYGKHSDDESEQRADGGNNASGWHRSQAGFRADWGNSSDGFTLQGDGYNGRLEQTGTRDIRVAGANLLGRISKKLSDGSDIRVQAYLDHTERDQPNAYVDYLDTVDLEFQHSIELAETHQLVWGAGYRYAWDRINNRNFAFLPGSFSMQWANVFVQDEIEVRDDLRLTLGLKLENNTYTDLEYLPTVRLAWKPATDHLIWGSASRAVRVPSRIDRDFFAPTNPPVVGGVPQYAFSGGPDFVSEIAKVYEIGYRAQPLPTVSYSLTAFHSTYDRLRSLESNPDGPGVVFSNKAEGTVRGIEMWGNWQAAPSLRLSGGLVAQKVEFNAEAKTIPAGLASNDPSSYWMLRSSYDISESQQFDVTLRRMGALSSPAVPGYYEMDMRFGWKIRPDLELSLVGQNLLHASHTEFESGPTRSVFERSLFLKMLMRF